MKAGARIPVPGLVWGAYPQRDGPAQPAGFGLDRLRAALANRWRRPRELARVRERQAAWRALDDAARRERLASLRAQLARDGWDGALRADALGCVAAAGARALGRDPYDTQLAAAGVLLDDALAEMATGEGKTYAAALAAAVAALAGVPVHVMTANDYLVERDARLLAPLYAALGLRVGSVVAASSPEQRRAAYACDVTYCTAREVAFDYLRDRLADPAGELQRRLRALDAPAAHAPLLRGLCMALLDEADSLLIDEATLPLVLSQRAADPRLRAACVQALALARALEPGRDATLAPAPARVEWLPAGEQRLEALAADLDGAWLNRRHRQELVGTALHALHLLERDRDYLVRDGSVLLLDRVTGRVAEGRVWSRSLQTLVELKEGLKPGSATQPCAQISFQSFFARYLRLCGMSGTLAECRAELRARYRREVVAIALRRPSRRLTLPARWYADAAARRAAVAQRVAHWHALGRPVLVGTDSVVESEALAALLAAAGIAHRVLNARHDAAEAAIVEQAGQRGAVTVATQMAGRGTDIELGPGVAALGGLHVIDCPDAPSRRLARQLVGRGARQGDPGSAETFYRFALSSAWAWRRKRFDDGALTLPRWLLRAGLAWQQRAEERSARRQRTRLLEQEKKWQQQG